VTRALPPLYGRFVTAYRLPLWTLVALLLALLALARPIDHDESQYVAATLLAARGLPYRDFAYLQTPLQPLLFAPVAAIVGGQAWIALRLANAALGLVTLLLVERAARRAGASETAAFAAALLMGACDSFLFGAATARNDMLPATLLAAALALRPESGRREALLTGLVLSAAAAAKLSYALPALAVGGDALLRRERRAWWIAAGAVPMGLLVAGLAMAAPAAFWFEVITFPIQGPGEWYARTNPAKLSQAAKALDWLKFLALGPGPIALIVLRRVRAREPWLLLIAGIVASLLPVPTWRQYLLPMLPPLFVGLALAWSVAPPGRGMRIATAILVVAGLSLSIEALLGAARAGLPMLGAARDGTAIGAAYRAAGGRGPVATLSPQWLPAGGLAIDPRFAAGPFYFRGRGLLTPAAERRMGLVSVERLAQAPLSAVLTGAEPEADAALAAAARARGMRAVAVPGTRFTLWLGRH